MAGKDRRYKALYSLIDNIDDGDIVTIQEIKDECRRIGIYLEVIQTPYIIGISDQDEVFLIARREYIEKYPGNWTSG